MICFSASFLQRKARSLFGFLVGVGLILTVTGCTTSKQSIFTATGPGWKVEQGQALWQPRRDLPEIAGDLLVARHEDGRCLVEFAKPPMTMATAQVSSNRWLIRFPPQNLGFGGRGRPSKRFIWLHLPRALEGRPLPKGLKFSRGQGGDWTLENLGTGEKAKGFLEQ